MDSLSNLIISRAPVNFRIPGAQNSSSNIDPLLQEDDLERQLDLEDQQEERRDAIANHTGPDGGEMYSFEIDTQKVEEIKKRCIELDFPMLEEYDFRNDEVSYCDYWIMINT